MLRDWAQLLSSLCQFSPNDRENNCEKCIICWAVEWACLHDAGSCGDCWNLNRREGSASLSKLDPVVSAGGKPCLESWSSKQKTTDSLYLRPRFRCGKMTEDDWNCPVVTFTCMKQMYEVPLMLADMMSIVLLDCSLFSLDCSFIW